ncbi:MAG: hypothetical protein KGD59_07180 [Candidatus Heimdallarchaeota archaeon]|nr:hypothetical protein [Candidatus Heimdallarchaeota archaeon]MBY8994316.1 hypothetical protein [Candidatus Heimdallarchaeota archaeon]
MTETEPRTSFSFKEIDRSYYIAFISGLIVLLLTIILTATLKGVNTSWLDVVFYPLIIYFIFQQVLSGFGFITGYIPIAQKIIYWLQRTAKKKSYSEKDVKKFDNKLNELERKEKREHNRIKSIEKEISKKEAVLKEKREAGSWSERKIRREEERIEKEVRELKQEEMNIDDYYSKEKQEINDKKSKIRGKFGEKMVQKQEEMDPKRFKLIMLVPIYFMMILGIILSLISIIRAFIVWPGDATPASEFLQTVVNALGVLDLINEYYKGIIAAVFIITFFIIPAVRLFKNPEKDIAPKVIVGRQRRVSDWWKRKIKKDHRTLLVRQFEDIRRYYYDIKQIIGRSLLIPIGLSQLIVAPIGGLSIILGLKSGVERKRLEKYENLLLIIVAGALMGILVAAYIFFYAKEVKTIHSIIVILMKLLYIAFLIYSFRIFTRSPLADTDEL